VTIFRHLSGRGAAIALIWSGLFPAFFTTLTIAQPDQGVPVVVEQVREQSIQQIIKLTGTVTSARAARLSTSVGGLVTALHVDAGSQVKAGEVLLELDAALAQWQWQSLQASTESARLAAADSRRRLEEARALIPQKSIAESVVRDLEAEVAQDQAELQRSEAEAGYRKGLLDRHHLQAPFSGTVSTKQTELGEWVDPGQPVLTLVATQELRMDFPVAEDYLSDIGPDAEVSYTLGDNQADLREGVVTTVVPITDPGARTFLLRIEAPEPDPRMMPGMSARAQLTLDAGRRGLAISRDAILKLPDGRVIVWVVESGGDNPQVVERRVVTGLEFEGQVEIREGLTAGDRVVVEGNEALQNGQRVTLLSGTSG
jgi:RND family efflux transporter MFP subunit